MKTEHRKELKENSLLRWISQLKNKLKGGPSRTTFVWMGVLVAALVGYLIYDYVKKSSREENSKLAREQITDRPDRPQRSEGGAAVNSVAFSGTFEPERTKLLAFVQKYPDTNQALNAEMQIARLELEEGLGHDLYVADAKARAEAQGKLESVAAKFLELSKKLDDYPVLVQECLFSSAKAQEGLGNLDEANNRYQEIISRFGDGFVAKEAQTRQTFNNDNKEALLELHRKIKSGQAN